MDLFVRTLAISNVKEKGYLRTLLEMEHVDGEKRKLMHFWIYNWVRGRAWGYS